MKENTRKVELACWNVGSRTRAAPALRFSVVWLLVVLCPFSIATLWTVVKVDVDLVLAGNHIEVTANSILQCAQRAQKHLTVHSGSLCCHLQEQCIYAGPDIILEIRNSNNTVNNWTCAVTGVSGCADPAGKLNARLSGPDRCPTHMKCSRQGWVEEAGTENTPATQTTVEVKCLPSGCVLYSDSEMSWCEAKQFCLQHNAILFSPLSTEELFSVTSNLTYGWYWVNAARLDGLWWMWLHHGRAISAVEWSSGEPDDDECGYIQASSAGLYDMQCEQTYAALCSINSTQVN